MFNPIKWWLDFVFGPEETEIEKFDREVYEDHLGILNGTMNSHSGPHHIDLSQFDEIELMNPDDIGDLARDARGLRDSDE